MWHVKDGINQENKPSDKETTSPKFKARLVYVKTPRPQSVCITENPMDMGEHIPTACFVCVFSKDE